MTDFDMNKEELHLLIQKVKILIKDGKQNKAYIEICKAMSAYPHCPEPHNLMGLLLEEQNEHGKAMNHFRAAYVLDPTYLPARSNLDAYGTMFSKGSPAYDENDCVKEKNKIEYEIVYDEKGIGKIVPARKGKK